MTRVHFFQAPICWENIHLAIFTICFGLIFSWLFPLPAHAATLEPPILEIFTSPGSVERQEIVLLNTEDATSTFTVEVQKFQALDEDGRQSFFPTSDHSDPVSWITVQPVTLTVPPRAAIHYPVRVSVPAGARPGGYEAAILFAMGSANAADSIHSRVGTLLLVHVSGTMSHGMHVAECSTEKNAGFTIFGRRIIGELPSGFVFRLANDGDDVVTPVADISVSNVFGHEVASFDANSGLGHALPRSIRRFLVSWPTNLKPLAIGPYQIFCRANDGGQSAVAEASFVVWVFPWKIILLIGVVVGILILLFSRYTRHRRV